MLTYREKQEVLYSEELLESFKEGTRLVLIEQRREAENERLKARQKFNVPHFCYWSGVMKTLDELIRFFDTV